MARLTSRVTPIWRPISGEISRARARLFVSLRCLSRHPRATEMSSGKWTICRRTIFIAQDYSARNAPSGSILDARRAGTNAVSAAIARKTRRSPRKPFECAISTPAGEPAPASRSAQGAHSAGSLASAETRRTASQTTAGRSVAVAHGHPTTARVRRRIPQTSPTAN
jgi:hypothetical protein